MLSCAGVYDLGADGSNACPAGSVRIETELACRIAAAATNMIPGSSFVGTWSVYPRGCYYNTYYDNAYFNTDPVGAGNSRGQLLCARSTTGAPIA